MEYYVEQEGTTATTVNVTCTAQDSSAAISWIGIIKDGSACVPLNVKAYSETFYIGQNTDCNNGRSFNGTIDWNGCVIRYNITQSKNTCNTCDPITPYCEIVNYYVEPYEIPPTSGVSATVYYTIAHVSGDTCSKEKKYITSSATTVIDASHVPCNSNDRNIQVTVTAKTELCDDITINAMCYVKKPDDCCDSEDSTYYEIGEISYIPSIVPYSGGEVSYYFDYKKVRSVKCKETVSYGRESGTWNILACSESDCCKVHTVTSSITFDDNTIILSILQDKDITANCEEICGGKQISYCVNKDTIKQYYASNIWKYVEDGITRDDINNGFTISDSNVLYNLKNYDSEISVYGIRTEEIGETIIQHPCYIDFIKVDNDVVYSGSNNTTLVSFSKDDGVFSSITSDSTVSVKIGEYYNGTTLQIRYFEDNVDIAATNYVFPYYGGTMNVTWEYDMTIYDECATPSATTISGNIWQDSFVVSAISASEQCSNVESAITKEIDYVFKTCVASEDDKVINGDSSITCSGEVQFNVVSGECNCNEFNITYSQYLPLCTSSCIACIPQTLYQDIPFGGGTKTDTFECDSVRVLSRPDWILVNLNNKEITYTITANTNNDINNLTSSRSGMVVFAINDNDNCVNNVVFEQDGERCEEMCLEPQIHFSSTGGSQEFPLSETCSQFNVVQKDDWITINKGSETLTISVGSSDTYREGKIVFTNGSCKDIITVTQGT